MRARQAALNWPIAESVMAVMGMGSKTAPRRPLRRKASPKRADWSWGSSFEAVPPASQMPPVQTLTGGHQIKCHLGADVLAKTGVQLDWEIKRIGRAG